MNCQFNYIFLLFSRLFLLVLSISILYLLIQSYSVYTAGMIAGIAITCFSYYILNKIAPSTDKRVMDQSKDICEVPFIKEYLPMLEYEVRIICSKFTLNSIICRKPLTCILEWYIFFIKKVGIAYNSPEANRNCWNIDSRIFETFLCCDQMHMLTNLGFQILSSRLRVETALEAFLEKNIRLERNF